MLEAIHYDPSSRIRMHISLVDESACEDDISNRYNISPAKKMPVEAAYLDPGGFAFSDTEWIEFVVRGITFSVKPEHLYRIDEISWRPLGESWVKVYLGHACLVIPSVAWVEVQSIIAALNKACPSGQELLAERLSDIDGVLMKG